MKVNQTFSLKLSSFYWRQKQSYPTVLKLKFAYWRLNRNYLCIHNITVHFGACMWRISLNLLLFLHFAIVIIPSNLHSIFSGRLITVQFFLVLFIWRIFGWILFALILKRQLWPYKGTNEFFFFMANSQCDQIKIAKCI